MLTGSDNPREETLAHRGAGAPCRADVWEVFDELLEREADPSTVLQSVARVLGRGAGFRAPDGAGLTVDADGAVRRGTGPLPRGARRIPGGLQVWLDGLPCPEEDLLLRRLGITVKVALRQSARGSLPAAEVVFDANRRPDERLTAARQLGLSAAELLTVIGIRGPAEGVQELVRRIGKTASVLCTYDDGKALFLAAAGVADTLQSLAVPTGVRAAFSRGVNVLDLPAAHTEALLGLRYALPATHDSAPYPTSEAVLVETAALGGYALLPAYLTREQIDTVEDVHVLDALRKAHGPEMLRILEAVAATDSVRQAARSVYLHHNSVAYRVERAEQALGFTITEPYGRTRLFIALCLRRVRDSAEQDTSGT
ncbi:helix-turn-helix domain-containing protein [Arthrobacter sp. zg-Y411]|uniref:helix-turn-helix domain-containing protein n=1 Tax=Arthrobacter zhangbolii TaxID=2886936 RepID=UPI001D134B6E|nr:helix-turn-helix domain-containing protein [Arthrobacter zhangbolii]MCC3295622.1 helix-turn-helix domain-containing protein [Arthrobacter zhangbolii]